MEMERLLQLAESNDLAAPAEVIAGLGSPNWRIRYAAAVAAERCGTPAVVQALLATLRAEAKAPLYSQRDEMTDDESILEAWRRRGRVRQAIYFTFAALGARAAAGIPDAAQSATDQGEDYCVRMAACHALGALGGPVALQALRQAVNDAEFCTLTEARRNLRNLENK